MTGGADVRLLVDYVCWVNRRLLDAASRLPTDQFVRTAGDTVRDLRATLVHELDVEWSWRLALQGRPPEEWADDADLRSDDFPDVAALRERWDAEERALRSWVHSLTDDDLAAVVRVGLSDRGLPRWQFVMHIVMHAAQQQSDAATLLTAAGASPGELGFLEFVRETTA